MALLSLHVFQIEVLEVLDILLADPPRLHDEGEGSLIAELVEGDVDVGKALLGGENELLAQRPPQSLELQIPARPREGR